MVNLIYSQLVGSVGGLRTPKVWLVSEVRAVLLKAHALQLVWSVLNMVVSAELNCCITVAVYPEYRMWVVFGTRDIIMNKCYAL